LIKDKTGDAMIQGLIGKKLGMTQLFTEDGRVVSVTVLKAGPCLVVQKKVKENNDKIKLQLGLVEEKKVKKVKKPLSGHFGKAGTPPTRMLKEFQASDAEEFQLGEAIFVDIFTESELVNIIGTTKGKGFQGVVKRWGFAGGRASHGSMFHRRPGSIGNCAFPAKVFKGRKMPGQMGGQRKTVKNLEVVRVDREKNLLLVKGAVPGFNGNYVLIVKNSFNNGEAVC